MSKAIKGKLTGPDGSPFMNSSGKINIAIDIFLMDNNKVCHHGNRLLSSGKHAEFAQQEWAKTKLKSKDQINTPETISRLAREVAQKIEKTLVSGV